MFAGAHVYEQHDTFHMIVTLLLLLHASTTHGRQVACELTYVNAAGSGGY